MGAWKNTNNRFVVFFDIAGFKDTVFGNDHRNVLEMMRYLSDRLGESGNKGETSPQIKQVLFSDSILIISEDDSINSAHEISLTANWLTSASLCKGVAIKGVMACGKQTADFKKSIHFGKPLIDACLLGKELLLYSVVLHHTAEEKMSEYKLLNTRDSFLDVLQYKTPMKSGNINHYVLDWTKINEKINSVNVINNLYNCFSGEARICIDNTLDFVHSVGKRSEKNGIKYLSPLLSR
jgi:hypothetical protein